MNRTSGLKPKEEVLTEHLHPQTSDLLESWRTGSSAEVPEEPPGGAAATINGLL